MRVSTYGEVKPCCVYRGPHVRLGPGQSALEAWRGTKFQELRRQFLAGEKPEGCSACWEREAVLGRSMRTNMWNRFSQDINLSQLELTDPEPNFIELDLNFGNRCNLKCRMCGSWGSHQWNMEDQHLNELSKKFARQPSPELKLVQRSGSDYEDLLANLTSLRRLDIKGGEPFLNLGHVEFLRKLIELKISQNISLHYVTNGTVIPSWAKEVFPHFKLVHVTVSLDGTGPLYRYIRGGKAYDLDRDIYATMTFLDQFENLRGAFTTTVQIYSAFDLVNIVRWARAHKLKRFGKDFPIDCMVSHPRYLSILILPYAMRLEVVQMLEQFQKNECFSGFDTLIEILRQRQTCDPKEAADLLRVFRDFTRELDHLRGTSLVEVEPRFAPLLQGQGHEHEQFA